jgi:hypothetical protein
MHLPISILISVCSYVFLTNGTILGFMCAFQQIYCCPFSISFLIHLWELMYLLINANFNSHFCIDAFWCKKCMGNVFFVMLLLITSLSGLGWLELAASPKKNETKWTKKNIHTWTKINEAKWIVRWILKQITYTLTCSNKAHIRLQLTVLTKYDNGWHNMILFLVN